MAESFKEWLKAEAPERRVYDRPPLTLALCQIKFGVMFGMDDGAVGPFQRAIDEDYPVPSREDIASFQVTLGGSSPEQRVQNVVPHWRFSDRTGNWTVTLTEEFLSLETKSYTNFEDFLSRLEKVMIALISHIKPRVCTRVGVRYIDEIRQDANDWGRVIRSEVSGVTAIPAFGRYLTQAIQVVSLVTENFNLNMQHGLVPTGMAVGSQDMAAVSPFYLIDMDVFRDFQAPAVLDMDSVVVCEKVGEFHEVISNLFRWATTEEYRAGLGVRS